VLGGITPTALAIGQLVTQAKIPTVVIISGASVTIDRSPFMTRTSFTLGQSSMIMGDWAAKNGSKKVVSLVNDWAPGAEAETAFVNAFTAGGGQVQLKAAREPGFAPFRSASATSARHRVLWYASGAAGRHPLRQFVDGSITNIRIIVRAISPATTSCRAGRRDARRHHGAHYSAAPRRRTRNMSRNSRRRTTSVGLHLDQGWDGMHLIYEALKKTNSAPTATLMVRHGRA
jgi:branched-chain amino acid transport system substrate-binding protein